MNIEGVQACHTMVNDLFGEGSIESILLTIAKDLEQGSRLEDLCGLLIDCGKAAGQVREVVSREMAEIVLIDLREIEPIREMLKRASISIKECPVGFVPIVCISLQTDDCLIGFTVLAEVNEHVHRLISKGGDA